MSDFVTKKTTHWSLRVDATLAARVEMALWDPELKKPRYRSRKMLVEYLLEEWLKAVAREGELTNA